MQAELVAEDIDKKRQKKARRHHSHKKDAKSVFTKGKERKDKLKSHLTSKRKLSQKHRRIYGKHKDAQHLHKTIQAWKLRWRNKLWRQKWKLLWGKSKWKASIRKRWNSDKKWRRKSMKKILKKWWDKKWRRKWMKRWIDNRWLNRWNRKRLRRKRLWRKRWKKSGAKKMGLSFNEFLLTERRLKALQRVPPAVINRRRKEKRLQKEKFIREKLERCAKYNEEVSKRCISERIYQYLFVKEYLGPETFGIRPSVVQFNFYMLNALQGLAAFGIVLYFHITTNHSIPREFTLQGLYMLVYAANAMDFFGSLFGMVTSYHLESYYGRDINGKSKSKGCFSNCFSSKKETDAAALSETGTIHKREKEMDSSSTTFTSATMETQVKTKPIVPIIKVETNDDKSVEHIKSKGNKSNKHDGRDRRYSIITHTTAGRHRKHRDHSESRKHGKRTKASSISSWQEVDKSKYRALLRTSSEKVGCQCQGLGFLYCSMIRNCFRPGRSREFINRMGYSSWILLQLAWFVNIFFTAYYTWLELYYKDYQDALARCETYPRMKHCDEFDSLYCFLLLIVGVTFTLRNIFVFIIGMCFPERYLKHCQSNDPNDEMPTTCSDTDIDYSKVPRQILVPHVLSCGKYPYALPGPSRPVDYMLERINAVTERNRKAQEQKRKSGKRKPKRKGDKHRRRVLSTYEKEAAKLLASFKQIRRAQVPLQKGRRKPMRIPVAAAVPDVQQLPPELMTAKAWAWLNDDTTSSDEDPKQNITQRRPVKWRKQRKKVKPIDSHTLTVINLPVQPSIQATVREKARRLSDRDSTDSSWSGNAYDSLFESASGYSSDDELDMNESDEYMEIMHRYNTEDGDKNNEDDDFHRYRPG